MNQNVNVDLFELDTICCDVCECDIFSSVIMLKRVPALMSPNGQEMEYAVQLLQCNNCGEVRYPNVPRVEEEKKIVI